jgi:hypothetical protein
MKGESVLAVERLVDPPLNAPFQRAEVDFVALSVALFNEREYFGHFRPISPPLVISTKPSTGPCIEPLVERSIDGDRGESADRKAAFWGPTVWRCMSERALIPIRNWSLCLPLEVIDTALRSGGAIATELCAFDGRTATEREPGACSEGSK